MCICEQRPWISSSIIRMKASLEVAAHHHYRSMTVRVAVTAGSRQRVNMEQTVNRFFFFFSVSKNEKKTVYFTGFVTHGEHFAKTVSQR